MTHKASTMACVGALVAGLTAPVFGAEAGQSSDQALRKEVAQLRAEVAELRQQDNQDWMTERRAEQVKTLVRDVLNDAETRSTLLQEGMGAGHDGENFYVEGQGFRMNLSGMLQVRYTANSRDENGGRNIDTLTTGFNIPRAKFQVDGHIGDPRIGYKLRISGDDQTNNVAVEVAKISYEFSDSLKVWGGETKAPFLREELTSASHQLAAERSLVNEIFTVGYVQGIGLNWQASDMIKTYVSINDGAASGERVRVNKAFNGDTTDFAVTGRVDAKLAGSWDQMNDFSAWSGEEMAAFVGGGLHYEHGETGSAAANNNFLSWTVDASIENQGWNGYVAGMGSHSDNEFAADTDRYGFLAQGGYNIDDTYEPFIRYEWMDLDSGGLLADDELNLVTAGINWFQDQHNAKFTADVVWSPDSLPGAALIPNTSASDIRNLGLLSDSGSEEDQLALRLQYQLLF